MDREQFWTIIDAACGQDRRRPDLWAGRLQDALMAREPDEIVEWNHIFDRLAADAYTIDLMAACWIINGGAGDDGFYYFRCWLVGMGREIYEAAMADPDSLSDVVEDYIEPGDNAEVETYAAAYLAWLAVTGRPDTDPYPARDERAELKGEDWDFDDEGEFRRRMPRLFSLLRDE